MHVRVTIGLGVAALLAACSTTRPDPGIACNLHQSRAARGAAPRPAPLADREMPRPAPPGSASLKDQIAQNFKDRQARLKRALPAPPPPGEVQPAPPPTYSVLALSARGQFGAYGAGFLQGWNERPDLLPDRADIDVVTGVSTGAMMAPYAYLGSSADASVRAKYDALLKDQYTTLHNADVFRPRSKLELLTGANSLYSTAPLRERIDRLVSDELVQHVIDEAGRSDRLLFVGAVDADSGDFEQFDLVAIANDRSHDRRACFAAAILASAAIPVAFEPVFINGQMYVDGGARKHTFLLSVMSDALPAQVEKHLFGILHGELAVPRQRTDNDLIAVASRTATIATDQLMLDSAWFVDAEAKQLRFRAGWTAAVDTSCNVKPNDDQFNPELGACLWKAGYDRARGDARPWKDIAFWRP